jgi:hypothetical protein
VQLLLYRIMTSREDPRSACGLHALWRNNAEEPALKKGDAYTAAKLGTIRVCAAPQAALVK